MVLFHGMARRGAALRMLTQSLINLSYNRYGTVSGGRDNEVGGSYVLRSCFCSREIIATDSDDVVDQCSLDTQQWEVACRMWLPETCLW